MRRPLGVTIIAISCYLLAVLFVCLGIAIILRVTALVNMIHQTDPSVTVGALQSVGLGGIALLFAAALEAVLGRGLWRLKNWARIVAIVLSALGVVSLLQELFAGDAARWSILTLFWNMFWLAINALIIWYLLKPDVSAAFRSNQPAPNPNG